MKKSIKAMSIIGLTGAMLLGMFTPTIAKASSYEDRPEGADEYADGTWWINDLDELKRVSQDGESTNNQHNEVTPNQSSNQTSENTVTIKKQNVKTPQVSYVKLYSMDAGYRNASVIKSRALAGNTLWFSDKVVTVDRMPYYRVATNEWAMGSDIILP